MVGIHLSSPVTNANFRIVRARISTLIQKRKNQSEMNLHYFGSILAAYLCVNSTFHALRELLTEQMSNLVKSKGMLLTGQEPPDSTVVSRKKMLLHPNTTKIFFFF